MKNLTEALLVGTISALVGCSANSQIEVFTKNYKCPDNQELKREKEKVIYYKGELWTLTCYKCVPKE